MLKNYFLIAFRNLKRNSLYSFINIMGLAVGLTCCLLIISYVSYELSFDKPHLKNDRIYRVYINAFWGDNEANIGVTPNIVAPILQSQFPEVERVVRVYNIGKFSPQIVKVGDEIFQEKNFYYADSSIFDVFTFHPVYGKMEGSLDRPNTLVLTRSASQKYFGNTNPVGKIVKVNGNRDYEITAVVEDMPNNVHFRFDMVGSFQGLRWAKPENYSFGSANFYTYVLLNKGVDNTRFEENVANYLEDNYGKEWRKEGFYYYLKMEPLRDIYLRSVITEDIDKKSDIRYVYLFSAIAVFVLVIACINYMNLSTARGSERAKEVGMRKMMGARQGELTGQFLGESSIVSAVAIILGIIMVELLLPLFRELSGRPLNVDLTDPTIYTSLLILWIFISLIAGLYPAVVLSAFKPSTVLKGSFKSSKKGSILRKVLVVIQFSISIFLIAGTAVIYKQMQFIQNKKIGYDKDHILAVPLDSKIVEQLNTFKTEFKRIPEVKSVTASSETPVDVKGGYSYTFDGQPDDQKTSVTAIAVDFDFVGTLGLELVAGNDYSQEDMQKEENTFLLNEAAAKESGRSMEDLLGTRIHLNGRNGVIKGVIKDFNYTSMYREIGPMVLFLEPWQFNYMMIRVSGNNIQNTLSALEGKWKEMAPQRPFAYHFLDQEFERLYSSEMKVSGLFTVFAVIAIFVACLGLLGLAAYMASQRAKEISVRKVMGGSVSSIVMLLTLDFAALVVIAFVIAAPLAWFFMNGWLNDFAYRTSFGLGTLLISGAIAFLVAWGTVAYQAIRAATVNPVDVLRYE